MPGVPLKNTSEHQACKIQIKIQIQTANQREKVKLTSDEMGIVQRQRAMNYLYFRDIEAFTKLVSQMYEKMGWTLSKTLRVTAEECDIIINRREQIFILRCSKRTQGGIGPNPLHDLHESITSEMANGGVFIALSTFTTNAQTFAQAKNIELINGEKFLQRIEVIFARDEVFPAHVLSEQYIRGILKTLNFCPECCNNYMLKDGKYGLYVGCSVFPSCDYTVSLSSTRVEAVSPEKILVQRRITIFGRTLYFQLRYL